MIFYVFPKNWVIGYSCPPRNHASRWIRDLWSKGLSLILAYFQTFLSFFAFWMTFSRFSKKLGFGAFLFHPPMAFVLLSASVERCFVSRMRDFFYYMNLRNAFRSLKFSQFNFYKVDQYLALSIPEVLPICMILEHICVRSLFAKLFSYYILQACYQRFCWQNSIPPYKLFKASGFWVLLVHPETTLPDGLETSGRWAYR